MADGEKPPLCSLVSAPNGAVCYAKNMNYIAFLGLAPPIGLVVLLVLLAILAFEIAMFVHVIRNPHISGNAKALWIIGMLLLHPFVAIVYYFTDYQKAH